jgi:hypothetical protein
MKEKKVKNKLKNRVGKTETTQNKNENKATPSKEQTTHLLAI